LGKKHSISYSDFVKSYSVDKSTKVSTLSYTSDGPHVNPKWKHKEIVNNAVTAIGCLTRAIDAPNVMVRSTPSKGVFATGSIAQGKLVLVPTSKASK